jgi:hypothetical protein
MDNAELLKLLEIASERERHHHNSLWEEEKHYSWWVYIILGGLLYLRFKLPESSLAPWQQALFIGLGSAFGFFISLAGYKIICRESEYFHEARQISNRIRCAITNSLRQNIPNEAGFYSFFPPGDVTIKCWDQVKSEANKNPCRRTKGDSGEKRGIRDWFKSTFIVTAIIFVLFGVFAVINMLH